MMIQTYKKIEGLEIETSFVYDVISEGELFTIEYVDVPEVEWNQMIADTGSVVLYTRNLSLCNIPDEVCYSGILVDAELVVTKTFCSQDKAMSLIELPEGSVAILAIGDRDSKVAFLRDRFHVGDMVKLKYHRINIPVEEVIDLAKDDGTRPLLLLDYVDMYTTLEKDILVRGQVLHLSGKREEYIRLGLYGSKNELIRKIQCEIEYDEMHSCSGSFQTKLLLTDGVNYIDVDVVDEKEERLATKSMIVFRKCKNGQTNKQVIMWVEQYVTAHQLNTPDKMRQVIATAKGAGVTAFALDVKGCEGFASYKKATLTKVPYITASINPKKQITMEIDFLEEFIKAAHEVGCKVYASINFFVEGNLYSKDYAIQLPKTHPDWAEVLHVPEDKGELVSVLHTKKDCMLCYVNPANDEVVEFELLRAREVIENYDVDGIILDRTRYDNQFADFSDVSKKKFEAFLLARGKELRNWPEDVYAYDKDQKMVIGELYYDWITFRSCVIKEFATKLRTMIEEYNKRNDKHVGMAAYVGSWYELYYQNGVNWASKEFEYNDRLKFPMKGIYTKEYAEASYLEEIDFLMIGCYYATRQQIEKYLTLGNILTNGSLPLIGSISLPHLLTKEMQRTGYQACYEVSEGCMIFDLCYVDWEKLIYAMKKEE